MGHLPPHALRSYAALLAHVYTPLLEQPGGGGVAAGGGAHGSTPQSSTTPKQQQPPLLSPASNGQSMVDGQQVDQLGVASLLQHVRQLGGVLGEAARQLRQGCALAPPPKGLLAQVWWVWWVVVGGGGW